jgi:hypothetical protein
MFITLATESFSQSLCGFSPTAAATLAFGGGSNQPSWSHYHRYHPTIIGSPTRLRMKFSPN